MPDEPNKVAARAAYRLGAVDTLLAAVAEGDIELAGIFVQQLEGERSYRLIELEGAGVSATDLEDMRVTSSKEKEIR